MKKIIFLITFFGLISINSYGQFLIKNNGDIHIASKINNDINRFPRLLFGPSRGVGSGGVNDPFRFLDSYWSIELNSSGDMHIKKPWTTNTDLYLKWNSNMSIFNMGIKKVPSSAYSLDVNGNIAVSGQIYTGSDARLKSNIHKINNQKTSLLYQLEAKSYIKSLNEYSIDENEQVSIKKGEIADFEYGFIAQELKEVFPELVSEDEEGYFSINYIGIIPMLVEVVKEQKKQLDLLNMLVSGLIIKNGDLKMINNSQFEDISINENLSQVAVLKQNTPNPFNTITNIEFFIPQNIKNANIHIYDLNGVEKKKITLRTRGNGNVSIMANELQAGMYLYSLICDNNLIDTKPMILTQ